MEIFVWWADPVHWKEGWKCATIISGGQCVMTRGMAVMPMWHVDSWDSLAQVLTRDLITSGVLSLGEVPSLRVRQSTRMFILSL